MKNTSTRMTLGRGLTKLPTAVEIKNICLIRNKANWNCNRFVCWIGFCCVSILCCCLSSGWMFQAGTVGKLSFLLMLQILMLWQQRPFVTSQTSRTYIRCTYTANKQALHVFTNNGKFHSPCNADVSGKQRVEKTHTHSKQCIHEHACIKTCMCGKVARTRLTLLGQSANGGDWQNRVGGMSWACCMAEAHSRTADSERRSHQKRMHQLPSSSRYMFN